MLKKKIRRIVTMFLALVLILEAVPADGVKAAAMVAKKVFVTIMEPTAVYEDIYGFFDNGYAFVTNQDNKGGIIDFTGKEIIPCGKYESIFMCKNSRNFVVKTSDKHGLLLDASGAVIRDYGLCDNAYSSSQSDETGKPFDVVNIVLDDKQKVYKFDGTFLFEKPYSVFNDDSTMLELKNSNEYSEVEKLSQCNDMYYYLAKSNSTNDYFVFDEKLNLITTIEGAANVMGYGSGFLKVVYKDADEFESNEIISYTGKVIIGRNEEGYMVQSNYSKGTLMVHYQSNEPVWKEYDIYGNVLYTFDNYDDVICSDEKGYYIGVNYKNDSNIREYFIINKNNNTIKSIGFFGYAHFTHEYNSVLSVVAQNVTNNKQYKKYYDLNGNLLFDTSKYVDLFDVVEVYGKHFYCKMINKSSTEREYSSFKIYNIDGSEFYDVGACKYAYTWDEGMGIKRADGSYELYDGQKNLICIYDTKYELYRYEYDGYMPVRTKDNKWGIVRLVDNPEYKKAPVNVPVNVPVTTPVKNTASVVTAPAKAKISKITAAKKKITVSLPKLTKNVKGYKIQYSLNKNFKKAKSIIVSKNKAVINKLKSGKKYYVRVKAYKLNGKKKVYSAKWSSVKKVKVK